MNFYKFYKNPGELNGYENKDIVYYVPALADAALKKKNCDGYDRERLETAISKNIWYSYWYAHNILKGPFPKGENVIAKSNAFAFDYASKVLKGPFPKGEDVIATDAFKSFSYACNVLKGPFPKGEKIMKDSKYWSLYQEFLSKLK